MAYVRNPFVFPLFCLPLDADIAVGEIVETDDDLAEQAARTGVFQWLDGPDGYDGKAPVRDRDGQPLTETEAIAQFDRSVKAAAGSERRSGLFHRA